MIGDTEMSHQVIDSLTSRIVLGVLTGFLGVSAVALPAAGAHTTGSPPVKLRPQAVHR